MGKKQGFFFTQKLFLLKIKLAHEDLDFGLSNE